MDAAFSYEGAADEASFVLGPALVGTLGVLVSPSGAMLSAAAVLAVFGSGFALHPTARLTGHAAAGHPSRHGRVASPLLVGLLLAMSLVGTLFGATQTGTTALADAVGEPGVAGLIHALLGVGSVLAGLATVAIPAGFGHERRTLAAAVALLLLSAPLLLVDSLAGLVAVVLALGLGVAPYMISVFILGERVAPPARVGLAMTLLAGATGVGYAVGSTLAGRLADAHGHTAAFGVTVGAMAAAVLLAAVLQRPARTAVARRAADEAEQVRAGAG